MDERRWWLIGALAAVCAMAGGLVLWRHYPAAEETPVLPVWYAADGKSEDVPQDVKRMWETQPLRGTPDPSHGPDPHASSDAAIAAASRVFNTVELVGKTRAEVVALLGAPKTSSDSVYNFPFWPAPPGALVYRFDTGAYGWQFNLLFDGAGRVRKVERCPIV